MFLVYTNLVLKKMLNMFKKLDRYTNTKSNLHLLHYYCILWQRTCRRFMLRSLIHITLLASLTLFLALSQSWLIFAAVSTQWTDNFANESSLLTYVRIEVTRKCRKFWYFFNNQWNGADETFLQLITF